MRGTTHRFVCQSCEPRTQQLALLAVCTRGAMSTTSVGASARLRLRLWSYALAEAIPKTRQRLHLSPQEGGTDSNTSTSSGGSSSSSSSSTFRIDAALASRLSDESITRGVPLASILLASLFLAATKAVRLEQEAPSNGSLQNRPFAVRAQRGFVLGIVCLVMALLSGSAESKAMRYFCSFYAVIAGIWAVNAISVERPGYTTIIATSASLKAGEGVAEVTITPAKLSVDCWHDLWETAGKHHREARGIASPATSFKEFKTLASSVRRRCQRERKGEGEARPPSQLFGCIQLEGSADGSRAAPAPEEALGIQPHIDATGDHRGDEAAASDIPKSAPELSVLQSIIDARYTLVYRERKVGGSERGTLQDTVVAPTRGGIAGERGNGNGDGDDGRGSSTVRDNQSPKLGAGDKYPALSAGGALGGIDLVLVERASLNNGKSPKWLLEEAMVILRDECGENPGAVGRTC